jgi:hypothetical protein
MKVSPPTNIMSPRPWNTCAERIILYDLMELIDQDMDEENKGDADKFL